MILDRLLWFVAGAVCSPLVIRFVIFSRLGLHICDGHPDQPLFPDDSRRPRNQATHR